MAKSNTKLTNLLNIEKDIQAKWTSEKIFEEDAPDLSDANTKRSVGFIILVFILSVTIT